MNSTLNDTGAESPLEVVAEEVALMNQPIIRAFFLVAYLAVFIFCIFGNSMILIVIISNRSMRTVTNYFLANLAVADLLVGMFCVFENAAHFVLFEHGNWPFGKTLCHLYIFVLHAIPNASAGILVLLSIERFIAVLRPMLVHHLLTKSVLLLSSIIVWGFSALMNLPYLIAVQYLEMPNRETGGAYGICTRRHIVVGDINILKVVTILNLFIWYITPLFILLCIYITIGLVLLRSTENAVSRSSQHNCINRSQSEPKTSRSLPKIEIVDSRRRVIRLVVVIVLCFAILSLPRFAYLTWTVFREKTPFDIYSVYALIQPITFLMLFSNSGINPVLYALLSKRFRAAINETFVCSTEKEKRKLQMLMRYKSASGAAEQQDQFMEYNNPIYAPTTTQSVAEEIPLQSIRRVSNDYY
ncbi:G-PROTEIN-RECEP-F1-2 domain-containing protein [Aphelenchoides bicaudatus]|nr:G-PROTEIN-RECEP-F1-2 domain-containing protein [Aphelenchoides bicaudatus]